MLKEFSKTNKTHIIIIFLFLAVSVLYCYPVLSGKVMNQNDDLSAKALTAEAEKYHEQTGEFIGWSNSMFSGLPTSVGYSGPSNYSINLIYAFANAFDGFSFDVIFWCFVGMYILLVVLGVNPWLSALGSFIFAFSAYNILSLEGGHVQKTFNIALVPLLLAGIYLIFQKKYLWGLVVTAFGVNYQVGLAHYQITYYAAVAAFVMCVFYGIKWIIEKEYKGLSIAIGILLLACVLGLAANLTVLNTYYASHETTRGGASELSKPSPTDTASNAEQKAGLDYEYATSWSYGVGESFTFIVPNAYGGASGNVAYDVMTGKPNTKSETYQALQRNTQGNQEQFYQLINEADSYWGIQPFVGGPYYFGVIVMFLFVFGLIASRRIEKWWLLALTLLFLFLAWGKHSFIFDLFFYNAPVFNKFRTPSIAIGVMQIGLCAIAILGLIELFKSDDKQRLLKILQYTGIGFGVLLLVMWLAPTTMFKFTSAKDGNLPDWFLSALADDREALMKKDALRSILYMGLGFVVMWLYLRGTIKANAMLGGVALLIVIDLLTFNTRYLNKDNFVTPRRQQGILAATNADKQIKDMEKANPHYRVFNLTSSNPFGDYLTSYHHHSVGGYHGAKLRKYQELIEWQINTMNPSVLSMLNTKYLIVKGKNGPEPQYPMKNAMGNAWFVKEVKVVENGDKEMAALNVDSANIFEPAQTLVVQQKNLPQDLKSFQPKFDSANQITLTSYAPHKLKYEYTAGSDQMAVFSEIFYEQPDGDGWKAFIDGQPAAHFRGDWVLRAMKVPAGKHTIEFKYDASKSLGRVKLSFVFFMVMLIICGVAIYMDYKRNRKAVITA